jgi:hypothetical protein
MSNDGNRPFIRFQYGPDYMAAMIGVYAAMSEREREELHAWEAENLDGGRTATSDWPGWQKYIGPPPWHERAAETPKWRNKRAPVPGYVYVLEDNGLY